MFWIFVCSNNLVRSVLAEAICRELAPNLKVDSVGLANSCEQQRDKDGHWVKSRGKPLRPVMRAFLSKRHIGFAERRARRLTDTDVREADVIWVMTEGHKRTLLNLFPEAECDSVSIFSLLFGTDFALFGESAILESVLSRSGKRPNR
jgi:protein-tyrosine-phosphatase